MQFLLHIARFCNLYVKQMNLFGLTSCLMLHAMQAHSFTILVIHVRHQLVKINLISPFQFQFGLAASINRP